jgi:hypothetical protein
MPEDHTRATPDRTVAPRAGVGMRGGRAPDGLPDAPRVP